MTTRVKERSERLARKQERPPGIFRKILVCSDGSEASLQAARLAALLAGRLQAQSLFLQVYDPSPAPPSSSGLWELCDSDQSLDQYIQQIEDTVEQRALPIFERAGVPCETLRAEGNPVEQIINMAKLEKTDLIVMGARGLSEWQAILLGSVSHGVLRHAPCPVLIARGETSDIHQILLATDGSPSAQQATETA